MNCQKEEKLMDFIQCLSPDVSICIMSRFSDPGDLARASAVSRTWRNFMIANGLLKKICVKRFPELLNIVKIVTSRKKVIEIADMGSNYEVEWNNLETDHEVFGALLQAITKSKVRPRDFLMVALCASSTRNFPQESISNTLNLDIFSRSVHWSSRGQIDPDVPETLIYKLKPSTWVITGFAIQAFSQPGKSIYAAKSVRIRVGHPKSRRQFANIQKLPLKEPADDKFVWTYTSPEFPMRQEKCLQRFKLPEPVLCIDAYLLVELLGRVQKQESDGLYYICINDVQALGRPLHPALEIEILDPYYEKLSLGYDKESLSMVLQSPYGDNVDDDDDEEEKIIHPRHLQRDMLMGRTGLMANLIRGIHHSLSILDDAP